jgi:hypothetical protein
MVWYWQIARARFIEAFGRLPGARIVDERRLEIRLSRGAREFMITPVLLSGRDSGRWWLLVAEGVDLAESEDLIVSIQRPQVGKWAQVNSEKRVFSGDAPFDRSFSVLANDPDRFRGALTRPDLRLAIGDLFAKGRTVRRVVLRDGRLLVLAQRTGLFAREALEEMRLVENLAEAIDEARATESCPPFIIRSVDLGQNSASGLPVGFPA